MLDNYLILFIFFIVVSSGLLLDLGIFNKKAKIINNKEALKWTLVWILVSMFFSLFILWDLGQEKFFQYQSAYWIEKMLSVDNLFVFVLVFNFFKLDAKLEHKVLFWGILGALIFRALFIFGGVEMVGFSYLPPFHWNGVNIKVNLLLSIFGFFLLITGIRTFLVKEEHQKEFGKGWFIRQIRKVIPISRNYYDDRFFIRFNGKIIATKLFLVLIVVEASDVLFAVDSVPAIFSIVPDDPYILYMSNIFAILGLRSLFFLLSNSMHKFTKLKFGLGLILMFIGIKMLVEPIFHIEAILSLFLILTVLIGSILVSLMVKQ